jgi:hypothetical protein
VIIFAIRDWKVERGSGGPLAKLFCFYAFAYRSLFRIKIEAGSFQGKTKWERIFFCQGEVDL